MRRHLRYLGDCYLVLGLQNLGSNQHQNIDYVFQGLVDLLNKNMQHGPSFDFQVVASNISLSVVLGYLYKLLRTFLHQLIFLKIGGRVEEQGEDNLHTLLGKEGQVLLPFQGVIQDVDALDEDGFDFKIINNSTGLVEKGDKDEFEDVEGTRVQFVYGDHDAHDYSFGLVYGIVLGTHHRVVVVKQKQIVLEDFLQEGILSDVFDVFDVLICTVEDVLKQ